jgi:hypothetical protein
MDYALEKELHSRDVCMSLPAREETYGDTERIIGTWFKKNRKKRRGGSLLK